ncbi:hypothetical protein [Sphingosinicella sp. BN140058]|uniref:hypothetical protein n=1 Tax=Sphingosinicella sp. BN140058 TaxID=1892855 RepID=UPI001012AAE1|nr:hypothetical protein [Sphingosinicella sp. BN140058]QAY75246.1 hypothetical protein ETR14_00880 [Sphingosinicella sp. BN140058]
MDETDAAIVRAELVALQAVLIAMMRRMARHAPELAPLVCGAFEDAEAIVTGVAMKMDMTDPSLSAMNALRVIEEMRAGVIKDEAICGGTADS